MLFLVVAIVAVVIAVILNKKKKKKATEALLKEAAGERARKKAEEEAAEKQAAEKQKKLEEILKPSCEKGDCWWYGKKFYFTCPADCVCERKTYTKKDWANDLPDARVIPYMKRIEKSDQSQEEEIVKDFIKEYLKQYGRAEALSFLRRLDHPLFVELLFWLSEQPAFDEMDQKLLDLEFALMNSDTLHPIFKNASLYKLSAKDFKYILNAIKVVLDENALRLYFKDISNISIEQLFDADGNVLEIGRGGPRNGFYGACVYNVIQSWYGEDEENCIQHLFLEYN